jgi:hypothetical protein
MSTILNPGPPPDSSPPALAAARRDLQLAMESALEAFPEYKAGWLDLATTGNLQPFEQEPDDDEDDIDDDLHHHAAAIRLQQKRLHRLEKLRLVSSFATRTTSPDPTRLTVDAGALRLLLATVRAATPPKVVYSESVHRMHDQARAVMAETLRELDSQLTQLLGLDQPTA